MSKSDFAGTRLSENFCVRWSGLIRCPRDATYTFFTESDDGSQLFIDGKLVVDNGGLARHARAQGRRRAIGRRPRPAARLHAGRRRSRLQTVAGPSRASREQIVPAEVLFHHRRAGASGKRAAARAADWLAEFYELGGPARNVSRPGGQRVRRAAGARGDRSQPADRTCACRPASAVARSRDGRRSAAVRFSADRASTARHPPLVRLEAAEALGKSRLDDAQLKALAERRGRERRAGSAQAAAGLRALDRRGRSARRSSRRSAARRAEGPAVPRRCAALASYPDAVRRTGRAAAATIARSTRPSRRPAWPSCEDVLAGGDIQRGRDLFFGNKKAICATCHAVQGQGGKFGPDLTKIGAIRTPRDLLEAIVFPSASFARGYEPFTLVTDDGQVISGIISPRNGRRGLPGQHRARRNPRAALGHRIAAAEQRLDHARGHGRPAEPAGAGRLDRLLAVAALARSTCGQPGCKAAGLSGEDLASGTTHSQEDKP